MNFFSLKKSIEYAIYSFIFFLPWQTRLIISPGELNEGYFEYGTISLYATDIVLIVLIFLFMGLKIKQGETFNHKLKFSAYIFLVPILVSVFLAVNTPLALYKYVWILFSFFLFFLFISAEYSRPKAAFVFLVGVFFQALLGIWQFLQQYAFSSKWFGLAVHDPSVLGTTVIETVGPDGVGERWLRAYGGLDHPNVLGGLLAIAVMLAVMQIISVKAKTKNFYFLLVSYLFLFTFVTALFFTFSRSAWLACTLGVFVLLAIGLIRKDWFFQREILKIILFSGVLFFILFSNFNNLVAVRMNNDSRLEKKSIEERLVSFRDAWQISKAHPFFGAGLGNYSLALAELHPNQPAYFYQPAHNVFLLIAAEIGIFGLSAVLYSFLYIFYLLLSENFSKFGSSSFYYLSFLIALLVIMFFDHYLWSLHFGVLFLSVIFGIVFNPVFFSYQAHADHAALLNKKTP